MELAVNRPCFVSRRLFSVSAVQPDVPSVKFLNDVTPMEVSDDLRPFLLKIGLGFAGGQVQVPDQPTDDNRGTTATTGLAVYVNRFSALAVVFNEVHRLLDGLQGRGCKINRAYTELPDFVLLVDGNGAGILLAGIDDGAHSVFVKFTNGGRERQGTQDQVLINTTPPLPPSRHTSPKQVVDQGGIEDEVDQKAVHRSCSLKVGG